MKKIRHYLAIIALAATILAGPIFLQGMGAMANAASSWHASSQFAAGQSARSAAFRRPGPPCGTGGAYDC